MRTLESEEANTMRSSFTVEILDFYDRESIQMENTSVLCDEDDVFVIQRGPILCKWCVDGTGMNGICQRCEKRQKVVERMGKGDDKFCTGITCDVESIAILLSCEKDLSNYTLISNVLYDSECHGTVKQSGRGIPTCMSCKEKKKRVKRMVESIRKSTKEQSIQKSTEEQQLITPTRTCQGIKTSDFANCDSLKKYAMNNPYHVDVNGTMFHDNCAGT